MEEIVGLITTFFKVKVTIRRKELQSRRRGDSWRTPRSHAPGAGPGSCAHTCPSIPVPSLPAPSVPAPSVPVPSVPVPPPVQGTAPRFPSRGPAPGSRPRARAQVGSPVPAEQMRTGFSPPRVPPTRALLGPSPARLPRGGSPPRTPRALPCRPHPRLACAPTSPVTLGTAPEASRIKATSDRHTT